MSSVDVLGFLGRKLHPSLKAQDRRPPSDRDEAHRRCERVSRLIVKMRGHGLVAKIPRARSYWVTRYGHRVITAAITLHDHDFAVRYMTAP